MSLDTVLLAQNIETNATDQRKKASFKNAVKSLPEVVVKGKRSRKSKRIPIREQTVFINVEDTIDRYRDLGKRVPKAIESFMFKLLPDFSLGNGDQVTTKDAFAEPAPLYKTKFTRVYVSNFIVPLNDPNIRSRYRDNFYRCIYSSEVSSITVNETQAMAYITINCKSPDKESTGIRKTRFQGYSLTKTFYNPPYNALGLPDSNDVRRTLYWNPSVTTDANGNASVTFFNNRSAKSLNISAETVTSTGLMGVLNKNY